MKKWIFGIIAITPLFLIINLLIGNTTFFSENTGLYFFSALLQGNAAILSIVGVFFIFKIQSLKSSMDVLKSALLSDRGMDTHPNQIIDLLDKPIQERRDFLKTHFSLTTKSLANKFTDLEEEISNTKNFAKLPMLLVAIGIAVYAVGLFSAHLIHDTGVFMEFIVLYIGFLYEVICLFKVMDAIAMAFKEKDK